MNEWIEESTNSDQSHNIFSYEDFTQFVKSSPRKHIRNTSTYILDMMNFFNSSKSKDIGADLFENDHHDAPAVYGESGTKREIQIFSKVFKEEGINNKFILLVGPNGSAKSSFVKKIDERNGDLLRTRRR